MLAGCASHDESATPLIKPLTTLVTKDETARGYLLCRSSHVVLEGIVGTRKAGEAFEKRLELHEGRAFRTSPKNFGVTVPTDNATLHPVASQRISSFGAT